MHQRLRFTQKDPSKGYITNNLLIPKSAINVRAIKAMLTYQVGVEAKIEEDTGQVLGTQARNMELWDETEHHIVVPREFLADQDAPAGVEFIREEHDFAHFDLPDKIVPRPIQEKALLEMFKRRSGTVNLACGLGKTVLALHYIVKRRLPGIVVVNSGALMEQWAEEVQRHIGDIPIGRIVGEQVDWQGRPITLAMLQTLANLRDEFGPDFRRYFGVAFFDEGHHMSAPHFVRAADLFYGDRFSLTATATRADGLEPIYQYHLGPIIYQNLQQDLIPETTFHRLHWTPTNEQVEAMKDVTGASSYGKFCTMLATVDWRHRYMIEQIEIGLREGRDILVFAHARDHVRALYEMWPYEGAALITSEDVPDYKERIVLLKNKNPCFLTFSLGREALDKRSVAQIDIGSSFASSNDLQQAWGRSQRGLAGKLTPRINVYEDMGIKMSHRHCNDLRKYLKALAYPSENHEVEIDL